MFAIPPRRHGMDGKGESIINVIKGKIAKADCAVHGLLSNQ